MKNFEQNLRRLDEIIGSIDSGASLSDSLELYKEGLGLVVENAAHLNAFEAEVKILKIENGELKIENFN